MEKRTILITGASIGFGLVTSIELAKKGFTVIATMRNLEKASVFKDHILEEETLNRIHVYQLDVTSAESIDKFKDDITAIEQVDVLLNNAGYAGGGFCEEITIDEYRSQFETNVFGVMAVTQVVLPKMRKQKQGTIINMSSISGQMGFPGISPYASSKFAIEGYSESLRLEVKPFGINVVLIEPGSYQTNIWSSGKQISPRSINTESPYYDYMNRIEGELAKGQAHLSNPVEVANLINEIALRKDVKKLRYSIGKGTKLTILLKKVIPWYWWEKLLLNKLFK